MIFYDLNGKQHRRSLDYKSYTKDENSRSHLANLLFNKIKETFPNYGILEEFPCLGLKPVLFIDFMILGAGIRLAFECDGKQHENFTPYFHKDRRQFSNSILNDIKKEQWLIKNNIRLIRVSKKEQVENLVELINNETDE